MKLLQKKLFIVSSFFILVLATITVTVVLQKQQNTRSRAADQTAIPPTVCGTVPLDITLIIDNSGSMNDRTGRQGLTKLQSAIDAAQNFVNIISANTENHIALISFSSNATLENQLTTDYATIKSKIGEIRANGNTCHQCGAKLANQEISTHGRANAQKVAIFLTDGVANAVIGQNGRVSEDVAQQAAITEIQDGYTANKISYFTIGLGKQDVNESFLQQISTLTKAQYFLAPSGDQLTQIYQSISQVIGKGNISGTVFNDANNNGVLDTQESSLPNWTVNLKVGSPTSTATMTNTTTETGGYTFAGLCDGTYYVNEETQAGWTQTAPTNPTYYPVSILNGSIVGDKSFGNTQRACGSTCTSDVSCNGATNGCNSCDKTTNKCSVPATPTPSPTMTPVPTVTNTPTPVPTAKPTPSITPTKSPTAIQISINALLHNIGSSGDNANPTASSFSNKNPLHPTRNVEVTIFDLDNHQVVKQLGEMTYSSNSGSFKGNINLGTTIPMGKYYIKIQTDYHLRKLVPGIQTFNEEPMVAQPTTTLANDTSNASQQEFDLHRVNILPTISLVAGDADNSNDLSILDYNLFLGCYSTSQPATSCTQDQKLATDFNDDGSIDDKDFNLFIRELSVQNGE